MNNVNEQSIMEHIQMQSIQISVKSVSRRVNAHWYDYERLRKKPPNRLQWCWWQVDACDLKLVTIFEGWQHLLNVGVGRWCKKIEGGGDQNGQNRHQHLKFAPINFVSNIRNQHRCDRQNHYVGDSGCWRLFC